MSGTLSKLKLEKIRIKNIPVEVAGISELVLNESISIPGITGKIQFADWQGLKELGNVFAGDPVDLVFSTEGSDILTLKLVITSDESFAVFRNKTYNMTTFSFCSPWMVEGLIRQISKPYKDKFIHEIVKDLLDECGAEIEYIEPTKEKLENFVTPLWTGIHSIRHLLSFATSNESGLGGYLFWTNMKTGKVRVSTIAKMYSKQFGTVPKFTMNPANIGYEGMVHHMFVESQFDLIRHVHTGMNKIRNYVFDFEHKKLIETKNDIKQYSHPHLGKVFPMDQKYLDKKYWTNRYSSQYKKKAAQMTDEKEILSLAEGDLANRYSSLFADVFKVNCECSPDSTRRVGMIVPLDFPSQNLELNKDGNKQMKGEYLIRDIKHVIKGQSYSQFVCLALDGWYNFDHPGMVNW